MATDTRRSTRRRWTTTAILAALGLFVLVTGTTGVWQPGRLGVPVTGGVIPGVFLNYQQLVGVALLALAALIGAYAFGLTRRRQ